MGLDIYEILQCYDIYVGDCKCCNDIPLSLEEWKQEFLEETEYVLCK